MCLTPCKACFKKGRFDYICATKEAILKCSHLLARRMFAHMYANWTIFEWRCVIFNNETMVNKFNYDVRCGIGLEMEYMLGNNT